MQSSQQSVTVFLQNCGRSLNGQKAGSAKGMFGAVIRIRQDFQGGGNRWRHRTSRRGEVGTGGNVGCLKERKELFLLVSNLMSIKV